MQEFVTKKIDLHQKLFDEMLNRFDLSARDIATAAGISEVMISRFRRGKADLGSAKFLSVVAVVPEEARQWYLAQILGAKPNTNLRSLVIEASPQEKAEIFNALANWVVQPIEDTHPLAKAV
jgi:transcriptional regulator with XRE-family HTH domain